MNDLPCTKLTLRIRLITAEGSSTIHSILYIVDSYSRIKERSDIRYCMEVATSTGLFSLSAMSEAGVYNMYNIVLVL